MHTHLYLLYVNIYKFVIYIVTSNIINIYTRINTQGFLLYNIMSGMHILHN